MPVNTQKEPLFRQIRRNAVYYSMLLPFAVLFLIFGLVPVLAAAVLSFTDFDMVQTPHFVGLDNFIQLFLHDSVFPITVRNTLVFALVTGPLGYVLSFIVAWFINNFNPKLRALLTLIYYSPTLAGNVYFIWTFSFSGDRYGLANSLLMRLGVITEPLQWLTDTRYNMGVIILVILWLSMGAGFLSFVAGFQSLNPEYYEAGAIDGIRNRYQELWYITLPQMGPQLLFGAVMSISSSFAVGYQTMALVGLPSTDYEADTILTHMLDYGTVRYEMGYACAIALFLFAAMLITWFVINKAFSALNKG